MQPSRRVLDVLERLVSEIQPAHLVTLAADVGSHLEVIRAAARQNELLPLDLAEEIAGKLRLLLQELQGLPAEHQTLVIGAARYFVSTQDVNPDTQTVLGLDDDASVLNYVLRTIGRTDLLIDP